MKILLCGASGFIGSHLYTALEAAGHVVVRAARRPPPSASNWIAVDYSRDHRPEDWLPRLHGIDVAINAIGILRESAEASFEDLHVRAPIALFEAARRAGVRKILQVSALGADDAARSAYHLSKKKADDFLATLPVAWTIVQPSLVYGPGGASAKLFNTLAALPLVPLPGCGTQQVQPIHIDDLCAAIVRCVQPGTCDGERIALVGPQALRLREWLFQLRQQMKLCSTRALYIPLWMMRLGARISEFFPRLLLDKENLAMLERGNIASSEAVTRLLNKPPRPTTAFIDDARTAANAARLAWGLPLLRISLALVWIATGVISLGIFPVDQSYALLSAVGIKGFLAPWALYGAALIDIAFGFGIFVLNGRKRRWLWRAQIVLILAYMAAITAYLPHFWLHPFGPILKNIPLLALIVVLHEFEESD
ncbi:MAG TPA: NAD(P)H-binding protein [Burkholderiales bacterium]|nr:NAD(P)H-binding protein [Burkholderiales bacterium]